MRFNSVRTANLESVYQYMGSDEKSADILGPRHGIRDFFPS